VSRLFIKVINIQAKEQHSFPDIVLCLLHHFVASLGKRGERERGRSANEGMCSVRIVTMMLLITLATWIPG
jgi:hypothetical protein